MTRPLAFGSLLAALLCAFAFLKHRRKLCIIGLYRHEVRRAGPLGCFRCIHCHLVFADLGEAGERGAGYLSHLSKSYTRVGASGGPEIERAERQ